MPPDTLTFWPASLDQLRLAKPVVVVVLLALFWGWETWRPFFEPRSGRLRHGVRNIAIALLNTVILGLAFGSLTVLVTNWSVERHAGLLRLSGLGTITLLLAALVLQDAWMYVWHRANHTIPWLWRFHRMHHSDPAMDVTTGTRFHFGEHAIAGLLRLGLIPLLGFDLSHLLIYDVLSVAVPQFHHADISLGRCDRWLRWFIVTPDMHKVHHSRERVETDSNYATVLPIWDRLAGTFRTRADPRTIAFGLDDFDAPQWQTLPGMLRTPLRSDAERP
jgi:sterol desaturase/sphingolipid hydroxylase (fatty acid hydroxylase superfamily)